MKAQAEIIATTTRDSFQDKYPYREPSFTVGRCRSQLVRSLCAFKSIVRNDEKLFLFQDVSAFVFLLVIKCGGRPLPGVAGRAAFVEYACVSFTRAAVLLRPGPRRVGEEIRSRHVEADAEVQ